MKKRMIIAAVVVLAGFSSTVWARGGGSGGSHSVRGYTRQNGTYVAPHQATNPNSSRLDNWSTRGNTNPYTGRPGTVDPNRR